MSKVVLRIIAFALHIASLVSIPLTLAQYSTINQLSNGVLFPTNNLVAMNGYLYSVFGYGFNRAAFGAPSFSLVNLTGFTSNTPVMPVTSFVAIPEVSKLLYINALGGIFFLDPNNPTAPLVSNYSLQYFGDNYQNVYVYQIERKPNTYFLYLSNLIGKAIQKIDYANLGSAVRIISGPNNDLGYEMMSISPSNQLLAISSNGVNLDLYDINTDVYVKTLNFEEAAIGIVYRCVRNYPRNANKTYFFVTRTDNKGYLMNTAALYGMNEKEFVITSTLPESVKHVPNTNWMVIIGSFAIEFLNMEGTDTNTLIHTVAGNPNIYWGAIEFIQIGINWYLAASFVYMNGTSPTSTYLFTLPNNFCHFTCNTCSRAMDSTACLSCITGYTLVGSMCNSPAPGPPCASNRYRNNFGICTNCPTNCLACHDGFGFCSRCTTALPYKVDVFGKCVSTCSYSQFIQTISTQDQCVKCHSTCNSCTGSQKNQCSSCRNWSPELFTLNGTSCIDKCLNSTGSATTYLQSNNSCVACTGVGSCKVCSYPGLSYSCLKCIDGYYWYNGVCLSYCPDGLITDKVNWKCTSCEERGLNMIYFNGTCIVNTSCPLGFKLNQMRCNNGTVGTPPNLKPFINSTGAIIIPEPPAVNNSQVVNSSKSTTVESDSKDSSSSMSSLTLIAIIGLAVVIVVIGVIFIYFKCIRKRTQIAPTPSMAAQAPASQQPGTYGERGEVQDVELDVTNNRGNSRMQPEFTIYQASRPPPMEFVDLKKQTSLRSDGAVPPPFHGMALFGRFDAPEPAPYQPRIHHFGQRSMMDNNTSELQPFGSNRIMFEPLEQPSPTNPLLHEAQLKNGNILRSSRRLVNPPRNR